MGGVSLHIRMCIKFPITRKPPDPHRKTFLWHVYLHCQGPLTDQNDPPLFGTWLRAWCVASLNVVCVWSMAGVVMATVFEYYYAKASFCTPEVPQY